MAVYNHIAYGLNLSKKMVLFQLKKEKAYHVAPNSDTLQSISHQLSSINYPVLVAIDGRDSTFEDNDADAVIQKPQYFFMILKPARADNSADILAAQALCEANALQIQAKMIADSRAYINGLTGLMIDTFSISSIGPIGDGLFGVIMGFSISQGIEHKVLPAYWIE